jgi:hypothetical protein
VNKEFSWSIGVSKHEEGMRMAAPFLLKIGITHPWKPRVCTIALFCISLSAGLAGFGCEFPSGAEAAGEGPGHRAQELALSPQQELALGRQAYKEVLSNPREYGSVVPADRPECRRVRAVAQRIIEAAGIEPLQREINLRKRLPV